MQSKGVIALAVALTISLAAAPPADPSASVAVLHRCLVQYDQETAIGAPISGVLGECLVQPGDRVKAGQVLGRLQDGEIKAEVKLREASATNDVEIRLAKAKKALVSNKLEHSSALMRKGAMSREEYAQHKLEGDVAGVELDQAQLRYQIAGLQLEQSKASLRARELVSPHDGIVVDVLRHQAEPVGVRDEVFHVVNPGRLRVVGLVDVADFARIKAGQKARVIPEIAGVELPIEAEVFEGKVTFLDGRIDPLTRACKVHVVVANRNDLLQPGLEARIELDTEGGTPATHPTVARTPLKK